MTLKSNMLFLMAVVASITGRQQETHILYALVFTCGMQTQVFNKRTGQWKSGYAADQDPSGALLPWILEEYESKFELSRQRMLLGG